MPALSSSKRFILSISLIFFAYPTWAGDVEVQLGAGDSFVILDNTGAIERLRVDEATGNISRNGALFVHTTGIKNTFVGSGAGNTSNNSGFNSAFGYAALGSITTGISNSAVGYRALVSNTTGGANSAVGYIALFSNTTGQDNSAFGRDALFSNTTGNSNSAFGSFALHGNTTGYKNSAFGTSALSSNTTGHYNSAVGTYVLISNTTGHDNAAFGKKALRSNTTGNRNVALGTNAGYFQTTGSDNIYVANGGSAGESGQIKIGTSGTHVATHIAGIHTKTSTSGIAVLINANGTLGTTTSSMRFKENVRDMADASAMVMDLRPVVFNYREDVAPGSGKQYGLIAEEVAEVAPDLVALGLDGKPYAVRYHVLAPLLLNEMQKQQREIENLKQELAALQGANR